jgi:diguanylate cyclase
MKGQQRLARAERAAVAADGPLHTPLGAPTALFLALAGREWARARRYGTAPRCCSSTWTASPACPRPAAARPPTPCWPSCCASPRPRCAAPTCSPVSPRRRWPCSWPRPTPPARWTWPSASASAPSSWKWPRGRRPGALRVTVSVGVAQLRPAHLNLQSLLDDAQDAVLAARQAGGNCVRAAPVEARLRPGAPQRLARRPPRPR